MTDNDLLPEGRNRLQTLTVPPHVTKSKELQETLRIIGLNHVNINVEAFFLMARQPVVGQGLLIVEDSRSHSDIHRVGLLWTSDQPDADTSI
jgi:hypothetical protein